MSDRLPQLFTIGAFGFTESGFFEKLQEAGINTFCDIRRRRGVRGSEYAFVNSTRLQEQLSKRGIRYVHRLDVAPSNELRSIQGKADEASKTAKRKRTVISPEFAQAYHEQVLNGFDSREFIESVGDGFGRVVLFCVEKEPAACHRSLLAERLSNDLAIKVTDLMP